MTSSRQDPAFSDNKIIISIAALIVSLITILVYLPALKNDFINWDDQLYIYDNQHIQSISTEFFKWIFTTFHASNWHPLTWLSHAIDYAVWGLDPMGHHLTSIIFHSLNTFLVVILITRLIQIARRGKEEDGCNVPLTAAVVTGLLFGLHPLHVESVVWVSERKDLLCAFFFLLSTLSYLKYSSPPFNSPLAKGGRRGVNYILCLLFFILALMSKPMAVTLPVVFIILDLYPLERLSLKQAFSTHRGVLIEKLPFFILSLASSVITMMAQREAMASLEIVSFIVRIFIGIRALGFYLLKILIPTELSPLYPYPLEISFLSAEYTGALILTLSITIICILMRKRQKVLAAAWAYYVVTLLPVLGIIQVGSQAAADRYTYLPSLGPFLLAGLGTAFLIERSSRRKRSAAAAPLLVIILITISLSWATVRQTGLWKDSMTLWNRGIELFPDTSYRAYTNRGNVFAKSGNYDKAMEDFNKAININPLAENVYFNIGLTYDSHLNNYSEALRYYTKAIELRPDYIKAYNNRATLYKTMGMFREAMEDFNTMIDIDSKDFTAYYNLGVIYDIHFNNYKEAIKYYSRAIELNPELDKAYYNLGLIYDIHFNNYKEAIKYYSKAIQLNPDYSIAYNNRGIAYAATGRYREAIEDLNTAIILNNKDATAYFNRGHAYRMLGDHVRADKDFQMAADLGYKEAETYLNKKAPY